MPITKHWKYEQDIVRTSINGVCLANPQLKYIESERVVFNSNPSLDKITLLSGGGSGHEPLHLGFVGDNCLDVAVCGSIFASPSVKQIMSGLESKVGEKGAIVIVKNYTGDILHFGLAIERAKSKNIPVEMLIVQDDVSVGKAKNGMVGRRGLAGTTLVHKILGSKSSIDKETITLKELANFGQNVIDNLVTIGASLDHVTIPGSSATVDDEQSSDDDDDEHFALADNEIEIGMGIHNEPGVKRLSPIPTIDELISNLLNYLLDENDVDRSYVKFDKNDEVVLLVNNLGSTSNLELFAIQSIVVNQLIDNFNIKPVRIYTGCFTTALDGPGFSITLLNATKAGGKEILKCLDLPTSAPGWNSHLATTIWDEKNAGDFNSHIIKEAPEPEKAVSNIKFDAGTVDKVLRGGCQKIFEVEPKVTLYDTVAGDGDCGETLKSGATGIIEALDNGSLDKDDAVRFLDELTDIVESAMGGTSGGLYSIFISAMASFIKSTESEKGAHSVGLKELTNALDAGLTGLQKYTRARKGDRTLMDALIPFVETLKESGDLNKAKDAAIDGAELTRKLKAKFGRASYVGDEEFKQFEKEGGLPDPGAIGLAALISGFVESFQN